MGHSHSHSHNVSQKNIRVAFFLNIGFAIAEIIGGILTNSMAILADALHDLGDSLSLGVSWYFAKVSDKQPSKTFSYGYKRFSLFAALINGIVLFVGSLVILSEAIPRLIHPEHSNAKGMFVFAVFGIFVNGLAVWRLKSGKTMNERVVTWHLLEDVLGWVAVLIVSVVMIFKDIHILDPILSVLITLYILWNVVKNLKKTVLLFLQGVPEEVSISSVEEELQKLDNVRKVHHTHIWSQDGEHNILTTHILIEDTMSWDDIDKLKVTVRKRLQDLAIDHATIEIEKGNGSSY
ncbi:MAG: cation transporter [Candidatus Omnitrophica bacterium]|nr:cation transporter [Candidatus Omnitrophota bacterium]